MNRLISSLFPPSHHPLFSCFFSINLLWLYIAHRCDAISFLFVPIVFAYITVIPFPSLLVFLYLLSLDDMNDPTIESWDSEAIQGVSSCSSISPIVWWALRILLPSFLPSFFPFSLPCFESSLPSFFPFSLPCFESSLPPFLPSFLLFLLFRFFPSFSPFSLTFYIPFFFSCYFDSSLPPSLFSLLSLFHASLLLFWFFPTFRCKTIHC